MIGQKAFKLNRFHKTLTEISVKTKIIKEHEKKNVLMVNHEKLCSLFVVYIVHFTHPRDLGIPIHSFLFVFTDTSVKIGLARPCVYVMVLN